MHIDTMNTETNNPRTLALRRQYVNEITKPARWGSVRMFEEVSGWQPVGSLRLRLIREEVVGLTQDIVSIGHRLTDWEQQCRTACAEEQLRYCRSIRRWTEYRIALLELRKQCMRASTQKC